MQKNVPDLKQDWESAFRRLNKRYFSADLVKGYDLEAILSEFAHPGADILDFGCGKGDAVRKLRERGYRRAVGADPSSTLLQDGSSRDDSTWLYRIKNNRLPFPDHSLDLVYASGVLHHIEWAYLRDSIQEISRVLKPGGKFVVIEPRRSLPRTLGHWIVLSPVSRASTNLTALADCLRAEWPTYVVWLEREQEFWPMCQEHELNPVRIDRRLVTVVGILQRG